MNSGFNLSPVIGLLRVLPTEASSTAGSFGPYTKPNTESKEHSRQLGDFTELWRFLETTADMNGASTTVAQDCQTDYSYISPVPEPDIPPQVPGSFKKPRRVVTFAATVGLSDDVNSTKTHISTRFKTGLDDNGVKTFVGLMSRPVIKSSATPEARKIKIIQTLMTMFPETKKTLLRPTTSAELAPDGVHVFVDNSNILIGFYDHIKKVRGFGRSEAVRRPAFSFHCLSLILERGRGAAKRVLVGSSPITPAILEARELGYETSILERVEKERNVSSASSGSESAASTKKKRVEQSVDELLAFKILETILDYTPSTIVLASGDGAAGEYSPGFFKVVERCLTRGWNVELVAFKKCLSGAYRVKEFRNRWKDQFRFVALDGFAEHLLG